MTTLGKFQKGVGGQHVDINVEISVGHQAGNLAVFVDDDRLFDRRVECLKTLSWG